MKGTSKNIFKLRMIKSKFKLVVYIVLIGIICWFVSFIPRVIHIKQLCKNLQNQTYSFMIVFPDTMKKITEMPDFSTIQWNKLSNHVDPTGVRFIDYDVKTIRGVSGKQKCPSNIYWFAKQHFSRYIKTGNQSDLLIALRQIDFLAKELKTVTINNKEVGFWELNFNLEHQYNAKAPWHSAFHQAFGLIAMLEGFLISGDSKYLDIIQKGMRGFELGPKFGGLSYKTKNNGLFFQEVVTNTPHNILNGHMYALIMLYEIKQATGSLEAEVLCNLGSKGLIEMLPEYDKHGYSLYSLSPNPSLKNHFNISSPVYHSAHIAQLRTLAKITNEKIYDKYADKWENQTTGIREYAWIAIYVMFKDTVRAIKFFS